MKNISALLLLVCCWSSLASGQTVLMKPQYADHEAIVLEVKHTVPDKGVMTILWSAGFDYVPMSPSKIAVWAPPGRYPFSGVIFVTKQVTIEGQQLDVLLGAPVAFNNELVIGGDKVEPSKPVVPPEPSKPDLDPFLVRVAEWSKGLPKRDTMASLFMKYSDRIVSVATATIDGETAAFVAERKEKLGTDDVKWSPFIQAMNQDVKARWEKKPMDKQEMSNYWALISKGLK